MDAHARACVPSVFPRTLASVSEERAVGGFGFPSWSLRARVTAASAMSARMGRPFFDGRPRAFVQMNCWIEISSVRELISSFG
jgi:hypothetical protein